MLERVVNYYLRKKRIAKNNKFIKTGLLRVGTNCKIENLDIVIATSQENGSINITIGDDCDISGKIIIYNLDSKISIGNRVYIGPGTTLFCNAAITIEDDILFSWGITLIDTNAHSIYFEDRKNDVVNWKVGKKDWTHVKNAPILIKSKAWIGFNSIITKGVTVGEAAVVSCGSVVVKDVPSFSIVGGNPANIIKKV